VTDFLSNLAARAINAAPVIQPRPLTVFEPWPTDGALGARRPPDIMPDDTSTVETTVEPTLPQRPVRTSAREAPSIESKPARSMTMAAPLTEEMIHAASPSTRSDFAARAAAPRDQATPPAIAPIAERATSPVMAAPQFAPPPGVDHPDEPRRPAEPTSPAERLIVARERIDREPEKPPVPGLTPQTILIERPAAPATSPSIVQPVVERVIDQREKIAPPDRSRDGRSTSAPTTANEAPPEPPAPPVIHVTIGRVEVRATPTPAAPRRAAHPTSTLSLEDYLRSRNGGRR
jgi:hypothetical protein